MSCDLFDPVSGEVLEAELDGHRSLPSRQGGGHNAGRGTPGERISASRVPSPPSALARQQRLNLHTENQQSPVRLPSSDPRCVCKSLRQYSSEEDSARSSQQDHTKAVSKSRSEEEKPRSSGASQETSDTGRSDGSGQSSQSSESDEDDSDESDESEQTEQPEPSMTTDSPNSVSQSSSGISAIPPQYQHWPQEESAQMLGELNMPYGMLTPMGFHHETAYNQGRGATVSYSPTMSSSPIGRPSPYGSYRMLTYQPGGATWQPLIAQATAGHDLCQAAYWNGQHAHAHPYISNIGYSSGRIPKAVLTTRNVKQDGVVPHTGQSHARHPPDYSTGTHLDAQEKIQRSTPQPPVEQNMSCLQLKRSASEGSIGRNAAPMRSRSRKDLGMKDSSATPSLRRKQSAAESLVDRSKSSFFLRRPSLYIKRRGRQFKGCLAVGKKQTTTDEDGDDDDDNLTPVMYHPEPPYTDLPQGDVDIPANLSENTPRSNSQDMETDAYPIGSPMAENASACMGSAAFMESLESVEYSSSSEGDSCYTYSAIRSSASSGFGGKARIGLKGGNLTGEVSAQGEEGNRWHGDGGRDAIGVRASTAPRPASLAASPTRDVCGATSQDLQAREMERGSASSRDGREALGSCIEPERGMRGAEGGGMSDPEVVGQEKLEHLAGQLGRLPESLMDSVVVHLLTTLEPDAWPTLAGCEPFSGL